MTVPMGNKLGWYVASPRICLPRRVRWRALLWDPWKEVGPTFGTWDDRNRAQVAQLRVRASSSQDWRGWYDSRAIGRRDHFHFEWAGSARHQRGRHRWHAPNPATDELRWTSKATIYKHSDSRGRSPYLIRKAAPKSASKGRLGYPSSHLVKFKHDWEWYYGGKQLPRPRLHGQRRGQCATFTHTIF